MRSLAASASFAYTVSYIAKDTYLWFYKNTCYDDEVDVNCRRAGH
jgi:hypothetical protein